MTKNNTIKLTPEMMVIAMQRLEAETIYSVCDDALFGDASIEAIGEMIALDGNDFAAGDVARSAVESGTSPWCVFEFFLDIVTREVSGWTRVSDKLDKTDEVLQQAIANAHCDRLNAYSALGMAKAIAAGHVDVSGDAAQGCLYDILDGAHHEAGIVCIARYVLSFAFELGRKQFDAAEAAEMCTRGPVRRLCWDIPALKTMDFADELQGHLNAGGAETDKLSAKEPT